MRFLLLAAVLLVVQAGHAADLGELVQSRRMLEEPDVEVAPLKIPKKATTYRDFKRAQAAWGERSLIAPMRERLANKPWQEEAAAFARRALEEWPDDGSSSALPQLSADGQALLKKGCNDALIGYFATWARWLATDEQYASREEFRKWLQEAEKLPAGAGLARLIAADFLRAEETVKLGAGDMVARLLKSTVAAWSDGSYLPEEDFIYLRHVADWPADSFFQAHFNQLWSAVKDVPLPDWVRETLIGKAEVDRAWASRGSGWADSVSEEGWNGFKEHLRKARMHLVHAWQLRKDQSMAASAMITVCMGRGNVEEGEPGRMETPRLWFDRAVAAECDYLQAYHAFALSCQPRWGGSEQRLLRFAEACLGTHRFDTAIPLAVFSVVNQINWDIHDLRMVYQLTDIAPLVRRVHEGLAEEPTRKDKRVWQGQAAFWDWFTGDAAGAAHMLQACGPEPLPREAVVHLQKTYLDEAAFRAEVAILNSPAADEYRAAAEARAAGDFPAAIAKFGHAASLLEGPAAVRLRGLAGVAEVERKLAVGEWATVPTDPNLGGWIRRAGDWFATEEGLPAIRDADGPVRIVYEARVGREFELKATIDTSGEPKARWFPGVVFGDYNFVGSFANWYGAFVRVDKGRDHGSGRLFFRQFVLAPAPVDCSLQASNEFTLRSSGGKISWSCNGSKLQTGAKLEVSENGCIGIGSFKHTSGVTLALRKLAVRRLDIAPTPK